MFDRHFMQERFDAVEQLVATLEAEVRSEAVSERRRALQEVLNRLDQRRAELRLSMLIDARTRAGYATFPADSQPELGPSALLGKRTFALLREHDLP